MSALRRFLTFRRVRFIVLLALLALSAFVLHLDITIRAQFEGRRWALPARVYARPLELYAGMKLTPDVLEAELRRLDYRSTAGARFPYVGGEDPGTYHRYGDGNEFDFTTRAFVFPDGAQAALPLHAEFSEGHLGTLLDRRTGEAVTLARLDPLLIGSLYPAHHEDRVLVQLRSVPQALADALIAVEDRKFYEHHGIDPRGIARAAVATLTGQGVQGGSTLTQQLVKNYFLSSERTLRRKFTEMIMAVLLEMHYTKDEILEAYINEVYLGQEGDRAIHGFGLASHFFFARPVEQLELQHIATLVGMLKGPNYYEPRANPERALQRRDLVLDTMRRQEFVTQEQYVYAKDEPLGVTREPPSGTSPYPAFLELVQRQLRRDYRDEDLRSEGLRILTTLDPRAQRSAERALSTRLARIEKRKRRIEANSLEGAVVVTSTQDGEVQALVSGRNPTFRGFNRALDAQRPIGSLIKPVVYLTALAQPQDYTLITPLDDTQLILKQRGTKDWKPMNYDKEFHGRVPLRLALARSYNVATARLGLTLGVPEVMASVQRLGVERDLPGHASSLLGVNELKPIEVAQMYQTLASGGFRVPLRSIREILTADGHTLQRFPLAVEQMADPAAVYLLTRAMQGVVREGTAKGLLRYVSPDLNVAGKTGTTDELRDSWFAGFTGDRLAVVWVGRDDNTSSRLTGSSGAMTIWGTMMRELDPEPLVPPQPENIELVWIDPATGLRADEVCQGALELPFIRGSAPQQTAPCVLPSTDKNTTKKGWLKRMLD